ncbi:MAG TPA: Gfo/Idh/MocA family oxidoreductase [Bacteroides sp.]|nr:Gfo/Idh/MocA family oxidoreductase [Bacteroides sp.]
MKKISEFHGHPLTRRSFIHSAALTGIGLAVTPYLSFGHSGKQQQVRLGMIGVGGRGRNHLRNLLQRDDVLVPAICDIDPEAIEKSQSMIRQAGQTPAAVYDRDEYAFLSLLERQDIEGVIISTPWLWHTKMAVAAMESGKYAGVEVSAANTIEECWDLVDTSESTGTSLMILENVCYRRDVMAVLNMVRQGVFGELEHCRCGYRHDLREVKFNPGVTFGEGARGEARWRTRHSIFRNGDLYPTHGAGPVATMLDINRGNRFVSLVSMSTKSNGLHDYIVNHPEGGEDHSNAGIEWKLGDVVTTIIKTAGEETILVTHDTNLPRPYSLNFSVQGTKGIADFDSHTRRIYVEGVSEPHSWEDMNDGWLERYDHPLWKRYGGYAEGTGHGGMDFFVVHAFVECVKRKVNPPLDAYDAAAWSAITPLSEQSIARGGEPMEFPDFTRGNWINRKPVFAMANEY